MKELAQLPTPTIATRTFSSARPAPFVLPFAPLLSLMKFEVLLGSRWVAEHTRGLAGYRLAMPPLWTPGFAGKLVSHMPYTLDRGEDGQCRDHVDRRRQQLEIADPGALGEDQADRKYALPCTGRVAKPTLHSTPSASARARV